MYTRKAPDDGGRDILGRSLGAQHDMPIKKMLGLAPVFGSFPGVEPAYSSHSCYCIGNMLTKQEPVSLRSRPAERSSFQK